MMTHIFGINKCHFEFVSEVLQYLQHVDELKSDNNYSKHFKTGFSDSHFLRSKSIEGTQFYLLGNPILYNDFDTIWETINPADLSNGSKSWYELFRHLNGISGLLTVSSQKVCVITDPLGFFPFYLYQNEELWCWSSNLQNIIAIPEVDIKYNEVAIFNYVHNGHFLDNETWYHHISRLPAASICTLDFITKQININHYWSWNEWTKTSALISESRATYYSLLEKSITNLAIQSQSIGLSLSGGLDSRIIAFISKKYFDIHTFTFSTKESIDLAIAQKVSKILNCNFAHFELEYDNWLEDRIFAFLRCNGMVPINHFHEGNIYKELQEKFDIIMTGFFGGGIYANTDQVNTRINKNISSQFFYSYNDRHHTGDSFYDFNSIDPYIIDQKIRNLAALHVYNLSHYFKVAIPFYNLDWLKYNYSIDETQQVNHQFYLSTINQFLSRPLRMLKWQKTGIAPYYQRLNSFFLKIKIPEVLNWVYQKLGRSRQFYNYTKLEHTVDLLLDKYAVQYIPLLVDYKPKNLNEKFNLLSVYLWLSREKLKSHDPV